MAKKRQGNSKVRIKELKMLKASSLIAHAKNFRKHPEEQSDALRYVLDNIGYTDALLAREVNGEFHLLDGHLRAELSGDDEVPVLILDVTEDEANKILATHDHITSMAKVDAEILGSLIKDIDEVFFSQNAAMRKMVSDFDLGDLGDDDPEDIDKENDHEVKGMQLAPHEHYDYLVVLARDTHSWNRLCDLLELKPQTLLGGRPTKKKIAKNRIAKIGISRAITADDLIERLETNAKK